MIRRSTWPCATLHNNNNNNNNWFLYSAFLVWDTTQSALQCIITPVTGFNINPALIVHLLNSLGSILARCYFRGAHMPHHATNNVRILPGTHLYTCVESSHVDKASCWRTKSAGHWRESNPEPFDPESRVQSNIPRHLHGTCIIPSFQKFGTILGQCILRPECKRLSQAANHRSHRWR